MIVEMN